MELDSRDVGALTLTEALHERIRQDIILGALPPASKLKLEKLSKSYGTSINTLRESLSRLAADGLVVAEGQKGFTVLPVSIEDLREITEMRQLLECHALRQSFANADLDWEAKLVGATTSCPRSRGWSRPSRKSTETRGSVTIRNSTRRSSPIVGPAG